MKTQSQSVKTQSVQTTLQLLQGRLRAASDAFIQRCICSQDVLPGRIASYNETIMEVSAAVVAVRAAVASRPTTSRIVKLASKGVRTPYNSPVDSGTDQLAFRTSDGQFVTTRTRKGRTAQKSVRITTTNAISFCLEGSFSIPWRNPVSYNHIKSAN